MIKISRTAPLTFVVALALAASCTPKKPSGWQPGDPDPKTKVDPDKQVDPPKAAPAKVARLLTPPDLAAKPIAGDPMAATIHRLSNGMTVYISTDRSKPRVTAYIAVRAGSRHDPAESTGLAHYLEHMLFKGTSRLGTVDFAKEKPHLDRIHQLYKELRKTTDAGKRKEIFAAIDRETQAASKFAVPNEFDQLYGQLGITGVNAWTWDEETVYIADLPSNRLAAWAKVEGERLTDPQYRLFYPELEAVYEEKNASLDRAGERVSDAMMKILFPAHPYGTQPTIGLIDHLKTPAYQDMVDFFGRWYAPNNMAIALAGDVDAKSVLPLLEREFGKLEKKPLSPPEPGTLTPLAGRTVAKVVAEGENSVTLAWRTVAKGHADEIALEVMDMLADNASTGLINVDLLMSQKLPSAGSRGRNMNESGFWMMRGTAREGQSHDDVEKLLLTVVAKLKAGDFTDEDIAAIVLNNEIADKRRLERNSARAGKMVQAFLRGVPWADVVARPSKLRKVTRADVMRVAKTYLVGDYAVVQRIKGEHTPRKMDKPSITPIKIDTTKKSPFAESIRSLPADELSPEWLEEGKHFTRGKTPAGKLLSSKNARNDLFTVQYLFDRGQRADKRLCTALALVDATAGTGGLSAEAFKKKLYALGTTIGLSCSADTMQITVSGIDRNLERSISLLSAWLSDAKLDAATVAKFIDNEVSSRRDQVQEPSFVARALYEYVARGKDSAKLAEPSNQELLALKSPEAIKAMVALVADVPNHQHDTLYFGPRETPPVAIGQNHKKVPRRPTIRYQKARKPTIYFVDKKIAQSKFRIVWAHRPVRQRDRAVMSFLSEYVGGGMGGLVFQEIREARGLAYYAWASAFGGGRQTDDSMMLAGVETQADKTIDALRAMLDLLGKLSVDKQRFASTKKSVDQEFRSSRVDPRFAAAWVRAWDQLGYKSDPRPASWKAQMKLSPKTLGAFARKMTRVPYAISLTGDKSRIDMAALKKIGNVVEVKVDQLHSYGD